MEHRRLGWSGLKVSELCLGTMTFGRELDESGSRQVLDRFLEGGGNFIDTANVYGHGVSEEITGRALKGIRDEVVLATKVRFAMGEGPNEVGVSRKHIMRACEASLSRLETDYIDLYQVHCWDEATPLEETLSALSDLVRQGKVRYIGASNFAGWQITKAAAVSESNGFEKLVSLQPQYSLVERNIEHEVVPACVDGGLGIIPWGPLGQGWLTGKYKRGEPPPEGSRIAGAEEDWEEHWDRRATDRNFDIAEAVQEVAEATGKSSAQVALSWIIHKPGVTAPIIGATKMSQLEDNLGAAGWSLSEEQMRRLDAVSAPPEIYPYGFIAKNQRN